MISVEDIEIAKHLIQTKKWTEEFLEDWAKAKVAQISVYNTREKFGGFPSRLWIDDEELAQQILAVAKEYALNRISVIDKELEAIGVKVAA